MSRIFWLASYPKSGNTWMRILLANYMADDERPVDINHVRSSPQAGARAVFDEWAGVEASMLEANVIDRLRPGVYRQLAAEAPADLYIKTHDAWRRSDQGDPLFPPEITAGVLYVVRNPLDVAVSCAHHWGTDIEEAVQRLCDPSCVMSTSIAELGDLLHQVLDSWSGHVASWLDHSGLPHLVVRYEDLRRDTAETFARVLRFCGVVADERRLAKAVAFSDFAELQRQESEHGFRERPPVARGNFFRRGRVAGWREELPAALATRIIETHGEVMGRLGYTSEHGQDEVPGGSALSARA